MKKQDNTTSEFIDVFQERLLVTALTHRPDLITHVQKVLPGGEVFQDPAAKLAYECLTELYSEGQHIRPLSVMQRARAKSGFGSLRDARMSLEYDEMTPTSPNEILDSAAGVLSLYRRYTTNEHTIRLNHLLRSDHEDSELAESVYQSYQALTLSGAKKMEKSAMEAVKESLAGINEAMQRSKAGGIIGVTTGSRKLDEYTGGWMDDQLIILAGRSGMGKTAVAVDMALSAARAGVGVGFFSMEMPAKQLINRMAANMSGINQGKIRKGQLNLDEYKRVEHALGEIAKLPLYFYDDTASKDVRTLEQIATEWKRVYGIGLVFIDYLQYLEIKGFSKSYERVSEVTKAVKTMQRNLKVPVIALAQTNRDSEKRADPRPGLTDLKDSGQIEQEASIVLGLFNPKYYTDAGTTIHDETQPEGTPFKENAYCIYLLKNRDGEKDVRVDRYANLGLSKFSDSDIFSGAPTPIAAALMPESLLSHARNDVFKIIQEPNF